ncbi:hypothetical protein GOBAR_DD03497 [Gossypium barbadense]|nr:hypothetical protein GOBAR_DD03497 [Gossypium barbadense]
MEEISEGLARQFGNSIGQFVQYDSSLVTRGIRRYMQIWVKIDLGHGEGFFPVRMTIGVQKVESGRDASLRVPPRKEAMVNIGKMDMGSNSEDSPIKQVNGKKRQRAQEGKLPGTRPSKGEVKLACTYPNEHVANPTTTEARVYLQDLTVAEDLGFRKLMVEGHSPTIVKKAQFASRSVNRTAHAMVEEGRELSSSTYWIEEASVRVEEKAERDRRACCD